MAAIRRSIVFLWFLIGTISQLQAMVYDDRYFPEYSWASWRTCQKPSHFIPDIFIMTAHDAALDNDDSIGIPEIFGIYDLNKLANAITILTGNNPLAGGQFAGLIGRNIIYNMKGKLEAQGAALEYHQRLTDNVSFGFNFFAMHVFSRINFELADGNFLGLTPDQVPALDALRRSMQQSVGLQAPKFSKGGFSDIDLYVRFGNLWEYKRKFKRIDAGVRAGLLIPTGLTREINNPASVPFGGNGHWGVYGALDLEIEVKEDWKAGIYARGSKRFEKKKFDRLPLADEQPLFAAFVGKANIDPGLNLVVAPYVRVEDISDGLGIQAKYTYVNHFEDTIADGRFGLKIPSVELTKYNEYTQWSSEYLTLNLFYDFARVRVSKSFAPILSFMCDFPIQFFGVERVSKTFRVSMGIVFGF
ncbi:MAG: hypothetical protein AB7R69_03075 [Candidatus Babeliales bacterium]